jgi:pimeloyl-ACP methyl ester carboxylesterase
MEVKHLYYRGSNVHYKIEGKGKPIMLIHGYQADSRIWESIVQLIKNDYQVIIPDLPGHGNSPLIQYINNMEFLADILNRICLAQGIDFLSIAGHSMGGYVALAYASKYITSIDKLLLINSHPFADTMTHVLARDRETDLLIQGKKHLLIMPNLKNQFYEPENSATREKVTTAVKLALEQPVEGMIADLAGMMVRHDTSHVFQKSRFEISVIAGKNDPKFPIDKINLLPKEKFNLITLENCGHISVLEKPIEIAEIILK